VEMDWLEMFDMKVEPTSDEENLHKYSL